MMKICHVGAWNRNYGDMALQRSIMDTFNTVSPEPITFYPVDCQPTYFSPALIEQLNETVDALLVGGGGLVFHRPEDESVSGWQFNIRPEDLETIDVPLVLWGIGYNQFAFTDSVLPSHTGPHLRRTIEKAVFFSARDDGSRQELSKLAEVDPGLIEFTPDSGIFLPSTEEVSIRSRLGWEDELVILVNWAGDRPNHRFQSGGDEPEIVAKLAEILSSIARAEGAKVLLAPHIEGVDDKLDDVWKKVLGDDVRSLTDIIEGYFPPDILGTSVLSKAYQEADLVLGMRGHSNLIAFGQGTPFIPLGNHPKNRYFADTLNHYNPPHVTFPTARDFSESEIRNMIEGALENLDRAANEIERDLGEQRAQYESGVEQALERMSHG